MALVLLYGGTGLLIWGMTYHAKARGRHPAWAVLGIGGWFGLLLIFMIPDHTVTTLNKLCPKCGYDLRGTAYDSACPECGGSTGPSPDRPKA